jgi:hypothetical protein
MDLSRLQLEVQKVDDRGVDVDQLRWPLDDLEPMLRVGPFYHQERLHSRKHTRSGPSEDSGIGIVCAGAETQRVAVVAVQDDGCSIVAIQPLQDLQKSNDLAEPAFRLLQIGLLAADLLGPAPPIADVPTSAVDHERVVRHEGMRVHVLAAGFPNWFIERDLLQEKRARDLMEAGLEKRGLDARTVALKAIPHAPAGGGQECERMVGHIGSDSNRLIGQHVRCQAR